MILINFTRFICEKGVLVKFAILPFSVLIQMSSVLFSRTHSLTFPMIIIAVPHYHSQPTYVVQFCTDALLCTRAHTSLSPLLKCNFQYSNLKFRCATIYPFAQQWKETKSKLNRTSFCRIQNLCSYAKAPLRTNRANSRYHYIYSSFLIDMAVALLISTISYQQAIKSSENGLTLFTNDSERIGMACKNWMARRATRQMPCLYRAVCVCRGE